MIEMRIVDKTYQTPHGTCGDKEIQYRYQKFHYDWYDGKVVPPWQGCDWSEWKTAPIVKLEDIE